MTPFEINYKKLAVLLTPTFLRKPVFTALVRVLMQPLTTLHDIFRTKRDDHLFNLAHNGQVCRLKHALNSLDNRLTYATGFEISDINAIGDFVFAYDEAMPDTWWLDDNAETPYTLVYDETSILVATEAFVVFVPQLFTFTGDKPTDPRIVATVEQYRLVSRTATYHIKRQSI